MRYGRFLPSADGGRGLVHLAFNTLPIAEDGATLHVLGEGQGSTAMHGISENSQPKTLQKTQASKYWVKF